MIETELVLCCENEKDDDNGGNGGGGGSSSGVTSASVGHIARVLATWLSANHRLICRSNSDHIHHHHKHHHSGGSGSGRTLGQLIGDSLGAGKFSCSLTI